jgi:hypothetical protein
VDWLPNDGVIPINNTIKWDFSYRSIAEGETITNGNEATATATYTAASEQPQYEIIHTKIVLPYDDADQPITKQDHIFIGVKRDTATDNYSNGACVTAWEVIYNAVGIPRD